MYGPSESAQHDQQAAYVRCSRGLRAAWRDQQGLAAAEKALLALVALAMILMVGRIILNGSRVASDRSVAMLTESSGAPAISWNDSGSPSGGTTLGGGSSGSKGGGFLDGIGGALSDSWGAVKEAGRQVGGFVYGVGTGAVEMVKGTAELVWSVGKMTVGELIDPAAAQAERDKWGQVISVVVEDPGKLWDAITEPIVESWNRGDYGEAIGRGVFEAASTVVGPKGLNKIGTIGKVSSKADDVARIGNALDDVAKTGSKLDDAGRVGNKLDEAADASRISSTGPRKVCEGPSCLCFSSDTPVMTASGPQPISELRPGDLVLSKDEQTGETALRSVVQVFVTPKRPLMALTIQTDSGQTETLRLTDSHPMYAKGKGFVAARELLSGDELVNSAGARLIVVGSESLSERDTVYNLEVEGFHTYFAGRLEAWAHNNCQKGSLDEVEHSEPASWAQREFEYSPEVRKLAKEHRMPLDEGVALQEHIMKKSTKRVIVGEDGIARHFGVKRNDHKLPEFLVERKDGLFSAVEVKNQNVPNITHALEKFRDVAKLSTEGSGAYRMGRYEIYVKDGFKYFDDPNYVIGKDGVLTRFGEPIIIDGVPVHIEVRKLGPGRALGVE